MRNWFKAFIGDFLYPGQVQEPETILTFIEIIQYSLLVSAVQSFTQSSDSLLIDIDACSQLETN